MSMMRRRIIAIIAAALALIILGFSLVAILNYIKIVKWEDVDGTPYYAKAEDGVTYRLYAKDSDTPLKSKDYGEYKYYITALGTLVSINEETGKVQSFIPVDDARFGDEIDFGGRVLLFKSVDKEDLLSIEVHNANGSFTICRMDEDYELSPKGTLVMKESPATAYDTQLAEQLYSNAGYTLSTMKLSDPIKCSNKCVYGHVDCKDKSHAKHSCQYGEYCEYGLTSMERTREVTNEETGEVTTETYMYEPAYYIITDLSGNKHKVIIGDKLLTGEGYYVQYVNIAKDGTETPKDAVYVLASQIEDCLLVSAETYVTPIVCYPMNMNNYIDVEDFSLSQRVSDTVLANPKDMYKTSISFSYVDFDDRKDTAAAVTPYVFNYSLEGYNASDSSISACLYSLYTPTTLGTVKFMPSTADLVEYGFMSEKLDENGNVVKNEKGEIQYAVSAKYVLTYYYDVLDENNVFESIIYQQILISDKDFEKTGNYYTYSTVYSVSLKEVVSKDPTTGKETKKYVADKSKDPVQLAGYYDLITEVDGFSFDFLTWTDHDWVNTRYIDQSIAFVSDVQLTTGPAFSGGAGYTALLQADNSISMKDKSESSEDTIPTNKLFVNATQSLGSQSIETFGNMKVYAGNYIWDITSSGISVYNAKTGAKADINEELTYYEYNDIGTQVFCRTGAIGDRSGDTVKSITLNGKELTGAAGAKVEIHANTVIVRYTSGERVEYNRCSSDRYKMLWQTLVYASLVDDYNFSSEEEEAALINDPSKLILSMKITVTDSDGTKTETVYNFYKLTSRKAYITVNGNGGFYVYSNRVEKFVTDTQKFFAGEKIDPTAKN